MKSFHQSQQKSHRRNQSCQTSQPKSQVRLQFILLFVFHNHFLPVLFSSMHCYRCKASLNYFFLCLIALLITIFKHCTNLNTTKITKDKQRKWLWNFNCEATAACHVPHSSFPITQVIMCRSSFIFFSVQQPHKQE
mgnify:CR=1 FL=1